MIELYQAEWCPYSHKVRQRLTELGIDVVLRQVAADRDGRDALEEATGQRGIPALILDGGDVVSDTEAILDRLSTLTEDTPGSARHREKAAEHA